MNSLLPDVLLRGCALCPDMGAISQWLDERYGSGVQTTVRKKGEVQAIGFFMDYIDEALIPADSHLTADICRLLGSFLLEPVLENGVFKRDYVEGEKVNQINAIMSLINDKRSYASMRLRQEMFRDEPYGVSKNGEKEAVEAITPEKLYSHYKLLLATSPIEILYVGPLPVETIREYLLPVLKKLPRARLVHPSTAQGAMPETVRHITETMDVSQGKLVMGFRTGVTASAPQYPALLLMNNIYGGGITSKLFMNVREKMSLCYYASSGIDRFKGVMVVASGVDEENMDVAKDEILSQLEACRKGEISQAELDSSRNNLISSLKTIGDSPYSLDDFYLGQLIGGFDYTPEHLVEKLSAVTLSEIQQAAIGIKLDTVYFLKGAHT